MLRMKYHRNIWIVKSINFGYRHQPFPSFKMFHVLRVVDYAYQLLTHIRLAFAQFNFSLIILSITIIIWVTFRRSSLLILSLSITPIVDLSIFIWVIVNLVLELPLGFQLRTLPLRLAQTRALKNYLLTYHLLFDQGIFSAAFRLLGCP